MACDGEILVSLIEKRPSIYDFKHKDHSNRTVQDKLWEEISKEMDVSGMYKYFYYYLLMNYKKNYNYII